MLEGAGCSVSVSANVRDALEIMDKKHINLTVLDIMMPEMVGCEFTETM